MSAEDSVNNFWDTQNLSKRLKTLEDRIAAVERALSKEHGIQAPPITSAPDTIARLAENMKDIILDVKVETINAKFTFTKKDGTQGAGQRILVSDHTAQIYAVLWGEQCDLAETLRPSDYITIRGAYTKRSPKGALELQLGKGATIVNKEREQYIQ